jgi:prepilin-type processing-associated H-X9-DG protein
MSALNSDNTNSALMLSGSLGFLAKDARIYHCPSDTSFVPGLGYRVRSVAMNAFVGSRPFASDRHRNYQRMTDFNHPADTYVLLDEHPDSINDGWFLPVLGPADTRAWADLPGSYHDNGCTFSYADGHAEIHHWLDASTLKPISKRSRDGFPLPLNQAGKDLPWMMDRMSPSPDAGSTNSP